MASRYGTEESSQSAELLRLVRDLVGGIQSARLPLMLKKAEAARELGIGATELDALIKSNQITVVYYKEGGHPKVPLSEVERFIAQKVDDASRLTDRPAPPPPRKVRAGSQEQADAEVEKLKAMRRKRRGG